MQRCGPLPEPLGKAPADGWAWGVDLLEYGDRCAELNDAKRDVLLEIIPSSRD